MTSRGFLVAFLLLAGVAISVRLGAQSESSSSSGPTYSKDVAPILFAHCTMCHRPGEIAPMSLMTYADARPWARSIAARVEAGIMPPWHAAPGVGEFENDRRLTAAEKDTIAKWVAAGAPEGDTKDLPAPPRYTQGWTIGQPDAVLTMQEDYPIPASGTVAYRYFEVPTGFTEDKWIQAYEVRPGNRTVVHHVIVYARPPAPPTPPGPPPAQSGPRPTPLFTFADGMDIPAGQTGGKELPEDQRKAPGPDDRPAPKRLGASFGGYVPGTSSRIYPSGTATRVPAGSTIVFQMHYTPTGKPTSDRTSIGLVFAPAPPKTELRLAALVNGGLEIPAGAPDHRVDAEMTINRDVTLWSMLPHTHVRGKRWSYDVTYPDGRNDVLLSVPKYDFEWQTEYVFKRPLKLPKGTRLHATAWYDNSTANRSNPDPKATVWWGDQTWEEMMFTSLLYSIDPAAAPKTTQ
ncbi:MAG TPA: hypothetical protein VGF24_25815 [Vicinamibacterales bacterium]|jgi:hypothetical protein